MPQTDTHLSELAEIIVRRWELWPLGRAPPLKLEKPASESGAESGKTFPVDALDRGCKKSRHQKNDAASEETGMEPYATGVEIDDDELFAPLESTNALPPCPLKLPISGRLAQSMKSSENCYWQA